jgi:hypothetical protein
MDSAPFTFTVGQAATQVTRNINFGSANMTMPAGFNGQDSGQVYSANRGFGWSTNLSARAVGPTISSTRVVRTMGIPAGGPTTATTSALAPELASYVYNQGPAEWFIDLPNGTYDIQVSIGVQGKPAPGQFVSVQGITLFNDATTAAGEFKSATATVVVVNGKLSMTIGNGVGITYVNFVKATSRQLAASQPAVITQQKGTPKPAAIVRSTQRSVIRSSR